MSTGSTRFLFEVQDKEGIIVRLERRTFERHLPYRPETADYVEEAKATIEDPDAILVDDDSCHHYYRLGLGRGKFEKCYVRVLVYYRSRGGRVEGRVATFWLARRIGKGQIKWMRS